MEPVPLAVVIPFFNEESGVDELFRRLFAALPAPFHLICVDDGSTDDTVRLIREHPLRPGIAMTLVRLSRNFGHQSALMAGLAHVQDGTARIIVMDADLQDRPEDLPILLEALDGGAECAYGVRPSQGDSRLITLLSRFFYRLQAALSSFVIPPDAGTFCTFTARFLQELKKFSEHEVYFPGLRAFVGLAQVGVPVKRGERVFGKSRVGFIGLVNLSFLGLFCFSAIPTRVIFLSGLVITAVCFLLGILSFVLRVTGVVEILGWTTGIIAILGLAGIQITFLGIIGEYVGRIFHEAKGRPRWIVADVASRTSAECDRLMGANDAR